MWILGDLQNEFSDTVLTFELFLSIPHPDTVIKKTKQRFNNTRTLQTKINLTDMSQEVKLRPPHRIRIEDLGPIPGDNYPSEKNGVARVYRPQAGKWSVIGDLRTLSGSRLTGKFT